MSTLNHTPGPWRIGSHGPNGCYTVGTERGLMTAVVAHSINHEDQREQAVADARLIANAPALLNALREIAAHSAGYTDGRHAIHAIAVRAINDTINTKLAGAA